MQFCPKMQRCGHKNKKGTSDINIRNPFINYGADGRIRTAYLLITNQLLYQLSYAGTTKEQLLCLCIKIKKKYHFNL